MIRTRWTALRAKPPHDVTFVFRDYVAKCSNVASLRASV
jgi:hypothetical protein